MGWFTRPLPVSLQPKEYGHPEGFDFPNKVELDSVTYPEAHGVAGPLAAIGSTGERDQTQAPEYAGQYELGYLNQPGALPTQTYLAPAPGSQDLLVPRDTGGISGTNRILHSVGPVDGAGTDGGNTWTSDRDVLHKAAVGNSGPVAGGPDYGHSLTAAYYAQAAAQFNTAAAEASMVAAL